MPYKIQKLAVDPAESSAGETPPAAFFADLIGSLNFAHAYNTSHPVSQGWPDGLTVATLTAQPLLYRVPSITSQHTIIRFFIRASFSGASSAGGDITITSTGSGQSVTVNFSGASETKSADLTVGVDGEYDDIRVEISAPAGCSTTLFSLDSAYRQLPHSTVGQNTQAAGSMPRARHLAADGASTWVQPLQEEAVAASLSLSSFVGHAIAETAAALTYRRRSLMCWSSTLGVVAPGNSYMQEDYGIAGMLAPVLVRLNAGTKLKSIKYHLHVNALPDASNDQEISIIILPPDRPYDRNHHIQIEKLLIPHDGDGAIQHAWFSSSFLISEVGRAPGAFHPYAAIWISVPDGAKVRSLALWGE